MSASVRKRPVELYAPSLFRFLFSVVLTPRFRVVSPVNGQNISFGVSNYLHEKQVDISFLNINGCSLTNFDG